MPALLNVDFVWTEAVEAVTAAAKVDVLVAFVVSAAMALPVWVPLAWAVRETSEWDVGHELATFAGSLAHERNVRTAENHTHPHAQEF